MKHTKSVNVATVFGAGLFGLAFLVGLIVYAGFFKAGSTYDVSARVYNARGIAKDSTVFEAGLPVGIVTSIDSSGPDAIVTMRIDKGVKPLPVDSQVQLGLRSLIGEADVLLTPGHSTQMVRDNGSLGLSQDQSYTEVDQILNAFAPNEKPTRQFFQGLGDSVRGQGQNLNQTLGGFASLVNHSQPLTSILAYQRGQVADLVQYFGDVMGAIGQRSTALREFASGAISTFQNMANRDTELKAFISDFPYTVHSVSAVGAALAQNEPYLTRTVDHISQVVNDIRPVVPLITPGADNATRILTALGSTAPELKSLLSHLKSIQPSASKALPAIHAFTCQANPMIRFLEPYGPDIAAFFQDFGAADNLYDSVSGGHQLPGVLSVDPKKLVRGVTNQSADNGVQELLNLGVFKSTGAQPIYYHSLRPPGQRNNTSFGAGDVSPAQFGADHKYPRITEDCAS